MKRLSLIAVLLLAGCSSKPTPVAETQAASEPASQTVASQLVAVKDAEQQRAAGMIVALWRKGQLNDTGVMIVPRVDYLYANDTERIVIGTLKSITTDSTERRFFHAVLRDDEVAEFGSLGASALRP